MLWTAPLPEHRFRLKVWKLTHWRRVRRFDRFLRDRIEADYRRRMNEAFDEWFGGQP